MTDLEMKKLEKLEVDIAEVMAATRKLGAETTKLNTEIFWYPMALATGLVLVVGAVVKYLL